MTTHVFVYGTLQPGQSRWPALRPFGSAVSTGSAAGLLFDPGYGWPAAVFHSKVIERVPGVVVALRPESVDEALATLDDIEGVAVGLFERVVVDVGGQPCWAYHWPGSASGYRRITRWPSQAWSMQGTE